MKKSLIAVLVAAVLVASFGAVSSVYAYGGNPGGRNNGAGMQQQQYQPEDGLGLYHDEILNAFADALGADVADLEAEIDAGRTIIQIAVEDYGMSLEDAQALLTVGNFGGRGASWMGRGFMATADNAEFNPGGLFLGDGTCQIDGDYEPQYLQQGMARGRGW